MLDITLHIEGNIAKKMSRRKTILSINGVAFAYGSESQAKTLSPSEETDRLIVGNKYAVANIFMRTYFEVPDLKNVDNELTVTVGKQSKSRKFAAISRDRVNFVVKRIKFFKKIRGLYKLDIY